MARRSRTVVDVDPAVSVEELEWRYRWLGRFMFGDAPAIRAEQDRLDAAGGPIEERLADLEEFLERAGWRDGAAKFVAGVAAMRPASRQVR